MQGPAPTRTPLKTTPTATKERNPGVSPGPRTGRPWWATRAVQRSRIGNRRSSNALAPVILFSRVIIVRGSVAAAQSSHPFEHCVPVTPCQRG